VPLTVSPFLSLPQATTLPHTYRPLPPILPPSVIDMPAAGPNADKSSAPQKPLYVTSQATGHSAHPDQIVESCRALQEHLKKMQDDSIRAITNWDGEIRERDLAEKRRVAPGWLDVEESGRGLVPNRVLSPTQAMESHNVEKGNPQQQTENDDDGGASIDRAFGKMALQ
jgi:hypothetical protein